MRPRPVGLLVIYIMQQIWGRVIIERYESIMAKISTTDPAGGNL